MRRCMTEPPLRKGYITPRQLHGSCPRELHNSTEELPFPKLPFPEPYKGSTTLGAPVVQGHPSPRRPRTREPSGATELPGVTPRPRLPSPAARAGAPSARAPDRS